MSIANKPFSDRNDGGLDTIRVVFMNGVVVVGTKALLLRWLQDRQTWTFFGIVAATFLIVSGFILPEELRPPEDWQVALVTLLSVFAYVAILTSVILFAFYLSRIAPNLILPLTLIIFVVHVINQALAAAINTYFWEVQETATSFLIWRMLGLYAVVVLFEVVFTVYILPKSRLYKSGHVPKSVVEVPVETIHTDEKVTESPEVAVPKPVKTPSFIVLGGKQFDLSQIRMVQAEDNYVRVRLVSDTVIVRARMNDVVKSLPKTAGVHAHRSFWVSFDFITSQTPAPNGKLLLKLSDGETLTVPRARRKSVSQAIRLFEENSPKKQMP